MNDKERLAVLEEALAQVIKPLKGIPFNVVIRALAGHQVIPIDKSAPEDTELVAKLALAAKEVGEAVRLKPIERPRPNEVGNDIEGYILTALNKLGIDCARPTSSDGRGKSTGYPDLLIVDDGRPTYLEAKIFGADTAESSMRSFYLSPSESFKVARDARHLLMAFEMVRTPIPNSNLSSFTAKAFKLVDLHDLICDMKSEFNSDNRRLYAPGMILAQGAV